MQHQGLLSIVVYSKDDPGLTLTYFTTRSNFSTLPFLLENGNSGYLINYCSQ